MATISKTTNRKSRQDAVNGALALARQVRKFPGPGLFIDFDKEADVLYISLQRPQKATETVAVDDGGILLRYRKKELVGITVLEASKR